MLLRARLPPQEATGEQVRQDEGDELTEGFGEELEEDQLQELAEGFEEEPLAVDPPLEGDEDAEDLEIRELLALAARPEHWDTPEFQATAP